MHSGKKNTIGYIGWLALIGTPLFVFAFGSDQSYIPLAPLTPGQSEGIQASSYLQELFQIGIAIAAGLAVLAIAYGGIKYMMSDVVTSKSDAIGTIKNALLGLALAVTAWLILNTINPELTNVLFK